MIQYETLEQIEQDSNFVEKCLDRYKNLPNDDNGNKDWSKDWKLLYRIQQRTGIRKREPFVSYLINLAQQEVNLYES